MAITIWLAVSCGERKEKDMPGYGKPTDTTFKDTLPRQKSGDYQDYERIPNYLELTSLMHRFDSIIVRLWFVYGNNDSTQLVVLRKGNWGWAAESSFFTYQIDDSHRSTLSIDDPKRMEPKSGWDFFIDSLLKLHIMALPDMHKSLGHPKTATDDDVIVEVSSKKTGYTIYRYRNPALAQGENKDAGRMEGIMELIETELGFRRLRKF